MSIKMSKENICINQIIGQKEETFFIEGDEIVPDIKPDVIDVISSNGTICIYKKEIQDGKVKFDGCVYIYTIYVADDENASVRCINSSLDFSKTIEIANIRPDMQLETCSEIKSIECKILNGRKISLQASVKLKACVYSNENVEIAKDVEDILDIQKLNSIYNVNSLVGNGSTKVYAKDTIQIDNVDNLSEVIKAKIQIINKETKASYNKVLAKADANVKIVYITEDNRINSISTIIPIMGFIDIQNVNEDNLCEVNYELKNIFVKPNSLEEHSVYVECEIEIGCFVYENKQLEIIQDIYSPTCNLEYKQKNVRIMQDKRKIKQTCNIRKQEVIPEIGKNKILDVEVKPIIINSQIVMGRVSYEGEMNFTFLYESAENGRISSKTLIEPFNFNVADDKVDVKTKIETNINVVMQDFIVMPDESIDIKVDLEFELSVSSMEDINIINEIEKTENRNKEKYSIVIYYTKSGDTLWNIAKRFGSTIEDILRINKLENPDLIMPGEQLFIPR